MGREGRRGRGIGGQGLTGSVWPTQCRLVVTLVEGAEQVNFFPVNVPRQIRQFEILNEIKNNLKFDKSAP